MHNSNRTSVFYRLLGTEQGRKGASRCRAAEVPQCVVQLHVRQVWTSRTWKVRNALGSVADHARNCRANQRPHARRWNSSTERYCSFLPGNGTWQKSQPVKHCQLLYNFIIVFTAPLVRAKLATCRAGLITIYEHEASQDSSLNTVSNSNNRFQTECVLSLVILVDLKLPHIW